MTTITPEMIQATYAEAKRIYAGEITKTDAVNKVVNNTHMNKGSAYGYISTVIKMLDGNPFGRTIKADATDYFLSNIISDFNIDKFNNALHSVREHLEINQNSQHNLWELLRTHEAKLSQLQNFSLPDEVVESENLPLIEGTKKQITVNAYERNVQARANCIEHHGVNCKVCGFNFEQVYGEIGRDYIHVHHIKPLSEINEGYEVDPINDLIPVCPNCHAMLHKKTPPYTIEELREILNNNN